MVNDITYASLYIFEVLKYERRNRMKLNYLRERPDSETIIQDLPDIKNMTQEEMDTHNRLCGTVKITIINIVYFTYIIRLN
jgi:hypothetical protein